MITVDLFLIMRRYLDYLQFNANVNMHIHRCILYMTWAVAADRHVHYMWCNAVFIPGTCIIKRNRQWIPVLMPASHWTFGKRRREQQLLIN